MLYASHYTRVHMGTTAVVVLSRLLLLLLYYVFVRDDDVGRFIGSAERLTIAEHACSSAKRDVKEIRISGIIL